MKLIWFLGSKWKNTNLVFVNQAHYVENILRKFDHFDVDLLTTPNDSSMHFKMNKEYLVAQSEYVNIIGNVMLLLNYTRLDIAYAVNQLSSYSQNPSRWYWNALTYLLRYLIGTMD